MTVRDELVELLEQGVNVPSGSSFIFLRDHGPALLEALADAERMNWVDQFAHCLDWVEGEPIRRAIQADTGDDTLSRIPDTMPLFNPCRS